MRCKQIFGSVALVSWLVLLSSSGSRPGGVPEETRRPVEF